MLTAVSFFLQQQRAEPLVNSNFSCPSELGTQEQQQQGVKPLANSNSSLRAQAPSEIVINAVPHRLTPCSAAACYKH